MTYRELVDIIDFNLFHSVDDSRMLAEEIADDLKSRGLNLDQESESSNE